MYPAALYKIPARTVDLSQIFERRTLRKKPKIINKLRISWDKNTKRDLQQVCPEQDQDFLLFVVAKDIFS